MSNSDEKLKIVLRPYFEAGGIGRSSALDKCVMEIKQAFADEGYVLVLPKVTDGTLYPLVWAKANGYMTGQEWYDRFEKEVDDGKNSHSMAVIREAAKRAAGLEDKNG